MHYKWTFFGWRYPWIYWATLIKVWVSTFLNITLLFTAFVHKPHPAGIQHELWHCCTCEGPLHVTLNILIWIYTFIWLRARRALSIYVYICTNSISGLLILSRRYSLFLFARAFETCTKVIPTKCNIICHYLRWTLSRIIWYIM